MSSLPSLKFCGPICPPEGCAFRFGGEEFLIAVPGIHEAEMLALTQTWRTLLAEHGTTLTPASADILVCVAIFPRDGQSLGECSKAADVALYEAKIAGRNRDVVWRDKSSQLHIAS